MRLFYLEKISLNKNPYTSRDALNSLSQSGYVNRKLCSVALGLTPSNRLNQEFLLDLDNKTKSQDFNE